MKEVLTDLPGELGLPPNAPQEMQVEGLELQAWKKIRDVLNGANLTAEDLATDRRAATGEVDVNREAAVSAVSTDDGKKRKEPEGEVPVITIYLSNVDLAALLTSVRISNMNTDELMGEFEISAWVLSGPRGGQKN